MCRRLHYLALVGLLSAAVGIPAANAEPPQLVAPGRWRITLQNELPVRTEPVIYYTCIAPGAGERPEPPQHRPSDPCRVTSGGVTGQVLAFTVRCGANRTSSMRIQYRGASYDGVLEVTESGTTVRQIITAERVGSCDDPAPEGQE